MDFGLTDQQKKASLTTAKNSLSSEIYNLFIRLGIDPDAYNDGDVINAEGPMVGDKDRLLQLINSYKMVLEKLSEME